MSAFKDSDTKLQMLLNGEKIGMGATPFIEELFAKGQITVQQKEEFLHLHFPNRKKKIEENQNDITEIDPRTGKQFSKEGLNSVRATRCEDCGDLLNGGTFGYIFRSIKDPTKIIKGSSEGQAQAFSCPPDFEIEYTMYKKIARFFPANFKTISMVNVSKNWVENRRCYLEMDEIKPVKLTKRQKKRALTMRHSSSDNVKFIIDKIIKNKYLFMLLPGDTDPFRAEEGGGETSEWVEIGKRAIDIYFNILGISPVQYYDELNKLVDLSIANNILLTDIEFILGTVDGETRVYMIDFDKVEDIPVAEKDLFMEAKMKTIVQPMFPARKLPGEPNTTRKRRRGRKKKKEGGTKRKRLNISRRFRLF